MNDQDFTTVPVLDSFHAGKQIGELRILTSALPPTPDFVFTLGFEALQFDGVGGDVPTRPYVSDYRLVAVAPLSDARYIEFLQQTGKLGPNLISSAQYGLG